MLSHWISQSIQKKQNKNNEKCCQLNSEGLLEEVHQQEINNLISFHCHV